MTTKREPKIWNGRWGTRGTIYACAQSRAELIRMITAWLGYEPRAMDSEIRRFWCEDAWGNRMDGKAREVGIWIALTSYTGRPTDRPIRVWPAEKAEAKGKKLEKLKYCHM